MEDDKRRGMSFVDTLRDLEFGHGLPKIDRAWAEVTAAVGTHGKGGELSVKLRVTPAKDDPNRVEVTWDYAAKVPEEDRVKMIAYVLPNGAGISRRDSRQPELPGVGEPPRAVVTNPSGESVAAEVRNVG